MKRNKNWRDKLVETLDEKASLEFTWGQNDCALFASDLMESMTGVDPAGWFRGKYDTELGAYFSLHRSPFSGDNPPEGFNNLFKKVVSTLADENGMEQIPPEYLHRGDLTLVEQHEGLFAMGIFVGSGVAVASRSGGYDLIERPEHEYAWRIPY